MRYVMKIAYDGTAYAGWQRQKNAMSVQESLENAILQAFGIDARVTASGRTEHDSHVISPCSVTVSVHDQPRDQCMICHMISV